MAFIFPQFIRDQLTANVNVFDDKTMGLALFYSAPAFSNNDARYLGIQKVSDLSNQIGWTEAVVPGYPLSDDKVIDQAVLGNSTYLMLSEFPIDADMAPVQVRAVAFFIRGTVGGVVNPIIFITNTLVTPTATLVGGDSISPVPDAVGTKWFFGWANSNPAGSLVEGSLGIQKAPPEFEPAHTQHVWLYPQRVNVVANPSFELGTNHWRSNGTITRIDAVTPGGGVKAGKFTVDGNEYDSYLTLNGSTPSTTPDHNSLDILGDVDLRADIAPNDWTPAVAATLIGKHSSLAPTSGGYVLRLDVAGTLSLNWSNGTATITKTSTAPVGLADGTRAIVRATMDVDNGAAGHTVRFYYSINGGTTWVDVGTPVVTAGITNIGNSTYTLTAGANVLSANGLIGKLYGIEVRNGIGGTIVANPDYRYLAPGTTNITDSTGKVWTKNASAVLTSVARPFGGKLVVESNKFPGRISNDWTIRVLARGNGKLKIGLLAWPVEFDETSVDWGLEDEEWTLPVDGYASITVLRSASEIYEGQLRLETDGTELTIDKVICEPGFLLDWEYFDGDTTYAARDDYSWYGGDSLKGRTYSLFYNNKRATAGRLFATKFPDRAASTSEDELAEGLVYQWVPAGTLIEPHWDVLFEGDLQHLVPDLAGTPVTPYRVAVPGTPAWSIDMGVNNPWDPEEPL